MRDALRLRHDHGPHGPEYELPDPLVPFRLLPGYADHGGKEALVAAAVLLGLDAEVEAVAG